MHTLFDAFKSPSNINNDNFKESLAILLEVDNVYQYFYRIKVGMVNSPLTHYWSLSLESQFYVFFPFLLFFKRKWVTFSIIIIFVQFFIERNAWNFAWAIRSDGFLCGALLAYFSNTNWYKNAEPLILKTPFLKRLILALLFLGLCKIVILFRNIFFYTGLITFICSIIVWIASYQNSYIIKDSILKKTLVYIGSRSYGIYLIHPVVFSATKELYLFSTPANTIFNDNFFIPLIIPSLFITLILAETNYRWLEQPLRKRGRKIAQEYLLKKTLNVN